ncbi:HAD family hydrolase [bacterium]|nr:HAD family hydrolase [bacterium]
MPICYHAAVKFSGARIIAFDNDGTLYPAGAEVCMSVLEAHRVYVREHGLGLETPDIRWVQKHIGADAKEFYSLMMPGQPRSVVDDFEDYCLHHEKGAIDTRPHLYEGAVELLSALKDAGRILLLVSNGSPRYLKHIWDAAGYGAWFSQMYPYGPPDYGTKGERLKLAHEDWGGGAAVMIGDRRSDWDAAQHAGLPFIGCRYGYGEDSELSDADHVVDDISELRDVLL